MQKLPNSIFRIKLVKYLFLSASISVFILIFVILYTQTKSIDDHWLHEYANIDLLKDSSLNIQSPIFEGRAKNTSPYIIKAQHVVKNRYNEYLFYSLQGECFIANSTQKTDIKATIEAGSAILDELKQKLKLNNNVIITYKNIVYYSREVLLDLNTQDINSSSNTKIVFKNSKVQADKLHTQNSASTIEFSGNVNFSTRLDEVIGQIGISS